jgi:lysophospholipase L1-like esterase
VSRSRLLPIASVVVALLAVGTGGFISWQRHGDRVDSDVITRPAPELGPRAHLLLPDLRDARVVVPDRPHDPAEVRAEDRFERIGRTRAFLVSTNSRGLRGPEVRDPKSGPRILCLGDSVTFGWGVPYEASYPALLSDALGLEVIDAGVPAMKPNTIAAWAKSHAKELQPDLVIFTRRPDWGGPDAYRDFERSVRQVQRAIGPAKLAIIMPPVSTFDVMGSQQWEAEGAKVRQLLPDVPLLDLTPAFRAALPRPGVILEQEGTTQRVVRLPDRTVVLEASAPEHGLAPEIVALFEDDAGIVEPLFFDGGHPTSEGFVVFVAALTEWMESEHLRPGAPPHAP